MKTENMNKWPKHIKLWKIKQMKIDNIKKSIQSINSKYSKSLFKILIVLN